MASACSGSSVAEVAQPHCVRVMNAAHRRHAIHTIRRAPCATRIAWMRAFSWRSSHGCDVRAPSRTSLPAPRAGEGRAPPRPAPLQALQSAPPRRLSDATRPPRGSARRGWFSPRAVPVDLLVPRSTGSRRGHSARRTFNLPGPHGCASFAGRASQDAVTGYIPQPALSACRAGKPCASLRPAPRRALLVFRRAQLRGARRLARSPPLPRSTP